MVFLGDSCMRIFGLAILNLCDFKFVILEDLEQSKSDNTNSTSESERRVQERSSTPALAPESRSRVQEKSCTPALAPETSMRSRSSTPLLFPETSS
eukprot:Pgem_evm2s1810